MTIDRYLLTTADLQRRMATSGRDVPALDLALDHIVVGDAREALTWLPSDCVNLVHTSPPYNIDRPYQGAMPDKSAFAEYVALLRAVIGELKRIIGPGGSIFWQTGYTQHPQQPSGILPIDTISYQLFIEEPDPFILWDRIVWRYWGGHAFTKKFTNKHETILWFVKSEDEPTFFVDQVRERSKEYDKRNNFWGRNPGNVWEVDRVAYGSTEQTSHIAVFPEEITERIVRACSRPGELVLDPFSGSGTVPKVARSLSRRWIGVEISPEYAHESAMRLGYQQASEELSLASELMKDIGFHNRRQTLSSHDLTHRLTTWAHGVDILKYQESFQRDIAAALHDTHPSKSTKRAVWMDYDHKIDNGASEHPIVFADSLLNTVYKNRHNLNGVTRYATALEAVAKIVSHFVSGTQEVESWLLRIAADEPSSYEVCGSDIVLLSTRRRVRERKRDWNLSPEAADDNDGSSEGLSAPEESFQAHLPF